MPKRGDLELSKSASISALARHQNVVYIGVAKDAKNLEARLHSHERSKGIEGKMHYASTTNMYRAENTLMDRIEGQSRNMPLMNKMDSGAPEAKGFVYAISAKR